MFTDPLALEYAAESTWSFYRRAPLGGATAYFVEGNQTAPTSLGLRILHGQTGKIKSDPNFVIDRHVLSLSRTEQDSETKRMETAIVGLTVQLPNSGLISSTELGQMLYAVREFTSDATLLAKFLRGEL